MKNQHSGHSFWTKKAYDIFNVIPMEKKLLLMKMMTRKNSSSIRHWNNVTAKMPPIQQTCNTVMSVKIQKNLWKMTAGSVYVGKAPDVKVIRSFFDKF